MVKSRALSQCSVFTSPVQVGRHGKLFVFSRHATRTYVRPLVETLTKWTTLDQSPWQSDACTTLGATSRLSSRVVSSLRRMGELDFEARGTVVTLTSIELTYYCRRRSYHPGTGPFTCFTLHSWLSGVPLESA